MAQLSPDAFSALVHVLEDVDRPLGDLCNYLWQSPAASATHLALGVTIAALLQDDLLPKSPQRLVAIYILYDMIVTKHTKSATAPNPSSAHPSAFAIDSLIDSPLTIILFELVDAGKSRLPEQLFLSHLLTHSQSATNDTPVPTQISQAAAVTLWNALEGAMRSGAAVPKLNISSLRNLWTARHPDPSPGDRAGRPFHVGLPPVSGVVMDADPYCVSEPGQLRDDLGAVATLEDFSPAFVRIAPPPLPIDTRSAELRWIDPEPLHEVLWDPDLGMRGERGSELRDLIAKAMKSPIAESLQLRVISQLESEPKLVHLCGLSPQKLPDLVQNNAQLTAKLLLILQASKQIPHYYNALLNMDVNLHSIEVVNRLSNSSKLPADFVHTYISNCIASCGKIPDKYGQVRMVRIVCMFLKNLIRNKTIDVQEIFIEMQAFCIEYSRIREVADLFRSLKSFSAQQ